jgi:uracil phosphoribosyltransferase
MIFEATRDLATTVKEIETPLCAMKGRSIREDVVLVPVLRAGISMLFPARDFLPWSPVGFIGLERDEQTAMAHAYYQKFPAHLKDKRVLVLDPMLATGGSLIDTISKLAENGAKDISAVCIVAAPEGVQALHERFPLVPIYTAAMDSHLNDLKYIVPGLGDFGDRYFGT